jgi:hypothetical protein
MPELINTLDALKKKEHEERKFQASLKGVDIGDYKTEERSDKLEEMKLKAAGINAKANDVLSLQGNFAAEAGFGIGAGLGYSEE